MFIVNHQRPNAQESGDVFYQVALKLNVPNDCYSQLATG